MTNIFNSEKQNNQRKQNEVDLSQPQSLETIAGTSSPRVEPEPSSTQTTGVTRIYNLEILDESGSMSFISRAAISGFNETVAGFRLAQQKYRDSQEHFLSLMTFDRDQQKMIYDKVPLEQVHPLTDKEYCPGVSTPLYDAMGNGLTVLENYLKQQENATAVVTMITDGYENSSREYTAEDVKALVEKLTQEEGGVSRIWVQIRMLHRYHCRFLSSITCRL